MNAKNKRRSWIIALLLVVPVLLYLGLRPIRKAGLSKQLSAAISKGKAEDVKILLERGADPNGRGLNDGTHLHEAAWQSDRADGVEKMRVLIKYGADVRARDQEGKGNSALFWTLFHVSSEGTELLAESGADVNEPMHFDNTDDKSALDMMNNALINLESDKKSPEEKENIPRVQNIIRILKLHGATSLHSAPKS